MAQQYLTSTTAPNKRFTSREELQAHYKSDWHRYNLKRREANLQPITELEFKARLEAALALRRKKLQHGKLKNGTEPNRSHLKDKSQAPPSKVKILKEQQSRMELEQNKEYEKLEDDATDEEKEEEDIVIDPLKSLFDDHVSLTLEENIQYMNTKFDFFIPDRDFLTDTEGLIGYCAEKIHLGHICPYCQKAFKSGKDVQKHMIAKGHCKIRYEEGVDLDEWEVFYDFTQDNLNFLKENKMKKSMKALLLTNQAEDENGEDDDDDDDDAWEDVSDDEDDMGGYRDIIESHGFGVTELGELILPSGKVIGHRTLAKYYNQKFAPEQSGTRTTAVRAVLQDTYGFGYEQNMALTTTSSLSGISGRRLQSAGGGSGKGILVANKGEGFSALSMYRYRAAVKKSYKQESAWHRQQGKVRNNGNKFDKKGNRLITGVSVAHAKR